MNADGADLPLPLAGWSLSIVRHNSRPRAALPQAAPDAGESADSSGLHAETPAEPDQRFFHQADEIHRAEAAAVRVAQAAQVEDGVAHQLARAVIGDIAAAVDFMKGDAAAGEQFV